MVIQQRKFKNSILYDDTADYGGDDKIDDNARFPTAVENMGRGPLENLIGGGGLESIHEERMEGLKRCSKIPVKEFIC